MSRQDAMTPGKQDSNTRQESDKLADQYFFGFVFDFLGVLASWRLGG
jgi:hypothetical protein